MLSQPTPPDSHANRFHSIVPLLLPLLPAALSFLVLGAQDAVLYLIWWAVLSLPAIGYLPLTARLFGVRPAAGYLFAKPLALAINGLLVWTLSYLHILPFSQVAVTAISLLAPILCLAWPRARKAGFTLFTTRGLPAAFARRELLFGSVLLFAAYARTLRPAIESIPEKFMDYGFMMSLMRTDWLPAQDMWMAGEPINYYYFGQYLYTFLTKLAGLTPSVSYNLSMATTFAFIFTLSYALMHLVTRHMLKDRSPHLPETAPTRRVLPPLTGFLAAVMVQIAGNGHAFLYDQNSIGNKLLLLLQRIGVSVGDKVNGFYFPDSTRFIGYNPDTTDKTIHEFPYYSFLIGDLHPHLINAAFVLLLTGLLYMLFRQNRLAAATRIVSGAGRAALPGAVRQAASWFTVPHFLLIGVLLGLFMMCNFWDLAIYFAVSSLVLLAINIRGFEGRGPLLAIPLFLVQMALILFPFLTVASPIVAVLCYVAAAILSLVLALLVRSPLTTTGAQMAFLFATANTVALPFSLSFEPISKNIELAENHTPIYQLLVLWGVPLLAGVVFVLFALHIHRKTGAHALVRSDRWMLLILLCGVFLILIPETAFVVDIYRGGYSRANTMFKFTYQAFILFGLFLSYAVVRIGVHAWSLSGKTAGRVLSVALALLLLVPLHYPFAQSTMSWQYSYMPSARSGLDGAWQIGTVDSGAIPGNEAGELADDLACIRWFNDNVDGQPVILEMFGKSYRDNCRISAFTGLPTVIGWETHEHLWRTSNKSPMAWETRVLPRQRDITAFYGDPTSDKSAEFLEEYDVQYIIVGTLERVIAGRKLMDDGYFHMEYTINDDAIQSLGTVVFEQGTIYVVKVDR